LRPEDGDASAPGRARRLEVAAAFRVAVAVAVGVAVGVGQKEDPYWFFTASSIVVKIESMWRISDTAPQAMPVMAKPFPLNICGFALTLPRAMIPVTSAAIGSGVLKPPRQQQQTATTIETRSEEHTSE